MIKKIFLDDIDDFDIDESLRDWEIEIERDIDESLRDCLYWFSLCVILCYFDQEWRQGGLCREGGKGHKSEEDSQFSEEQDDWLLQ